MRLQKKEEKLQQHTQLKIIHISQPLTKALHEFKITVFLRNYVQKMLFKGIKLINKLECICFLKPFVCYICT